MFIGIAPGTCGPARNTRELRCTLVAQCDLWPWPRIEELRQISVYWKSQVSQLTPIPILAEETRAPLQTRTPKARVGWKA